MSAGVDVIVGIIKIFLMLWDLLTTPIYALIHWPWVLQGKKNRTRARAIDESENEITYRALPMECRLKDELQESKVDTLDKLFKFCVKKHGYRPCLGTREILGEEEEKQDNGKIFTKLQLGEYSWTAYVDVASRADLLGKGLRELGLQPRDKVVLYANTCADWMTTAIAAFKNSIAVVTIYTNLGDEGVIHGITQTDAGVVVASQELLPRLLQVLPSLPSVHTVLIIPNHKPYSKPQVKLEVKFYKIEDVVALGSRSSIMASPPDPEDTAIIMYTSGSTGVPKGVVLTHSNIVQATFSVLPTISGCIGETNSADAYVAYLPLAHVLEMVAEFIMFVSGISIGYATTNTLLDTGSSVAKGSKGDVTTLKPSVMCAVPLVLDRIYKGLQAGVKKKGEFTTKLVEFCYKYRLTWSKRGYKTPIMDRLIFGNLRSIIGGRVRVLLSGGAPLAPDAHAYCRTVLGITLCQGYGLTETTATSSIPDSTDFSTGRVGSPLQGVDIKLVNWEEGGYTVRDKPCPRGEIIIGGGCVAKEYYLMPEKTQEEFFDRDGKRWFRTGDIGQFHENGTLSIIDRKKDLVKLQGGEYVSLGKVESLLKIHPLVDNLCLYGDPMKMHTVALLVPDQAQLAAVAAKVGKENLSREDMCTDESISTAVLKELQKHGIAQKLAKFEIPQALTMISEVWTPEGGLVTAALKLKRKSIQVAFQDDIDRMYGKGNHNNNNNNNNVIASKSVVTTNV